MEKVFKHLHSLGASSIPGIKPKSRQCIFNDPCVVKYPAVDSFTAFFLTPLTHMWLKKIQKKLLNVSDLTARASFEVSDSS